MKVTQRILACVMAVILAFGVVQIPVLANAVGQGEVVPDVEVTISDSSRVDATLWFNVSSNDPFQYDPAWSKRYVALSGGVYLGTELREDAQLIKLTASEYIIFFENGMTPAKGTTVKLDGIFGDRDGVQTSKVKFGPMYFEYNGNSNWYTYSQEVAGVNTSGTDSTFWLDVTPADSMSYDSPNWTYQYGALYGGVYVNGTLNASAKLVKLYASRYIIYFGSGFSLTNGTKVKVDGIFGSASSAVKIVSDTYEYDGTWVKFEETTEPVEIYDSAREDSTLWFRVSADDNLPHSANWDYKYAALSGGVKVDGQTRSDALLVKLYESEYIVHFENGLTPVAGTIVEIEGTFGNSTQSEVFNKATFVYDGNNNWHMYKDEVYFNGVSREDTNLFFVVNPSDALPYTENAWTHYLPLYGGVYVNGELNSSIQLEKLGANEYLIYWGTTLTPTSGMKVKIDGIFGNDTYAAKITSPVLEYKRGTWGVEVVVPEIVATVTVNNDSRNNSGQTNSFFFTVDPSDPLESDLNWNKRYYPHSGGVYVDGVLNENIQIIKLDATLYLVYLKDYNITPVKDMKVTIDGVFGDANCAVEYKPTTFEYRGNGQWKLEGDLDEEDLTKDDIKVYDLYDFIEVSQVEVPASNPYALGQVKENANVGFQTHVKKPDYTMDEQDITFGFAKDLKTDVWADSGYQIVVRPQLGQIILRSGVDTTLMTIHTDAVKDAFDLEYGIANLRDDKDKVVARKVYVKVNGTELISYLDENLDYTLGTYLPIYAHKMSVVLESITHKGYTLVEKKPQVQDVSELHDGLGKVETSSGSGTYIGQSKTSTNIGLKAKIKLNTTFDTYTVERQDNMLFAFSKEQQQIWDAAGTGYQVEIRPGQVLVKCDVDTVVATFSCEIPKEFVLEIGTCDVDVYKDGKYAKAYGRKVYVKIDDKEVASWMDRDLQRVLGKEVLFYQSGSVDATISSLVSTKYLVREDNKVYDLNDASQYAEVHLKSGTTTQLGTLPKTTEVAFKTKVKMDPKSTEFKIAMSKTSEKDFWDADASGWQFGFKPTLGQVLLIYGTDTVAVTKGVTYPESGEFVLEIGQRKVTYNDGKAYGREIYIKIDGKEVASWIDKDTSRKLGNYVLAYVGNGADVTMYTLYDTTTLPVTYVVNGEETKSCSYIELNSKVVVGKSNKLVLTVKKDLTKRVEIQGFSFNDTVLEAAKVLNEYTYVLESPKKGDSLRVELKVSDLRTDEAQIFDLYDLTGQGILTIESGKACMIGNILGENGKIGANTAVRFRLTLPQAFNQFRVTLLGDAGGLWSYHGTLFSIVPGKGRICHPLNENLLETQDCDIFQPGSTFIVEMGIVKCYENGVYKYDRSYIKAGDSVETLETVVYYDSTQRGRYGTTVCSYGNDVPDQPFVLSSLKDIKTIRDVSSKAEKEKIAKILTVSTDRYALYYPETVVAGDSASIKFYTQEGMKLNKFTVNGSDVTAKVTVAKDGAYLYDLKDIKSNVQFAYQIGVDDTKYSITAKSAEHLEFVISADSVPAGGRAKILVKAQKGYVLETVTINGTDYTEYFVYDKAEKGWIYELSGIRQNLEIEGKAVAKQYRIKVNGAEHADVTFGGDIQKELLPAGGTLELTISPEKEYKIRSVSVNGEQYGIKDGVLKIQSFYTNDDTVEIEIELQEGEGVAIGVMGTVFAVGGGIIVLLLMGIGFFFWRRKREGRKG